MKSKINPIAILEYGCTHKLTADLQLTFDSITWNIYFINGELKYAHHSLQSLATLKYYLTRLAPNVGSSINAGNLKKDVNNLEITKVINALLHHQKISPREKNILLKDLTLDALESFLWLQEGDYQWHPLQEAQVLKMKVSLGKDMMDLSTMIKSLQIRHQLWQKLSKVVISPYQRPLFVNPSLARQKVPQGNLSPTVLVQLSKLMKKATIRDLATFLKQDELKIATLLAPYIRAGVITLQDANHPYSALPNVSFTSATIPEKVSSPQTQQKIEVITKSVENSANGEKSVKVSARVGQKKYKIISIDDSPTMLATIKDYLNDDKFEVLTVENPMESLSYLFESKPDLILMDLSMPRINGNRLSQILKSSSIFKNVPIVIISGNKNMLDKEKMDAIGAKDFLAKPFSREDLLKVVYKYFQNQYSTVAQ
ncbi:response regulator receiver protein [Cyanobacterium stanieri PCC 7202]|uniref:Protein PatA n=1 Tax=Cyanobacterium stanieri (strain ATCC 29140 / PCC 7202) TaxID=292563 RepID=K9YQX1_CYASC|nr:response regulator receiver protein [Cyanobacterium stanieri PCC 7202]